MPDISDPRFAAIATDPRFARFPKKQGKVVVDERFQGSASPFLCLRRCKRSLSSEYNREVHFLHMCGQDVSQVICMH
jgi:hypothetical protein